MFELSLRTSCGSIDYHKARESLSSYTNASITQCPAPWNKVHSVVGFHEINHTPSMREDCLNEKKPSVQKVKGCESKSQRL